MSVVHVVLPGDIDDPATPSGGNSYDRRVCQGLTASGWSVREHPVPGGWPQPEESERAALGRLLSALPDDAVVLVDGLVASAVPEVLVPQAHRLRLVVLVHMPMGDGSAERGSAEREALTAAVAVITTSAWTRRRLLDLYGLPVDRIHVAPPGVEPAAVAAGSAAGNRLLCVAAVSPHKGHDLLVEALATATDLRWDCVCVGALTRDPDFVERLRQQAGGAGLGDRVSFVGPRTGADLDAAYAAADLLVLASRGETYGMVVTEALARGIPVLATAVQGLPEAMGRASDGTLPGMLVEPEDPGALADAVRRWLGDPDLRRRLRGAARDRRASLTDWTVTSALVAEVLRRASGVARPVAAPQVGGPRAAAVTTDLGRSA